MDGAVVFQEDGWKTKEEDRGENRGADWERRGPGRLRGHLS